MNWKAKLREKIQKECIDGQTLNSVDIEIINDATDKAEDFIEKLLEEQIKIILT